MIQIKKLRTNFVMVTFFSLFFNFAYSTIDYLDTTFGPDANGIVTTQIDSSLGATSEIRGVTNSGGKIIVTGVTNISGTDNLTLARFNSDGTLDTSFNSGGSLPGVVVTTGGSSSAAGNAIAIDSNNNVIAAGINGSPDVLVVRYDSNGDPDSGFGTSGVATLHVSGSDASLANSVVVDGNDKILICGTAIISGQLYLLVARFNTDGSIDTSFNTVGYNTLRVSFNFTGQSLAIDGNAKIIAAGSASTVTGSDFLIARFNNDGTLDTNFNSGGSTPGIQTTTISGSGNNSAQAVLVDGSNKYIAAGFAESGGDSTFALVKYNNDGSLDTTFGPDLTGIVTTTIGSNARILAAAIDQDGNIVTTGSSDNQVATARYTANGSLDTTFGFSGVLTTTIGIDSRMQAITVQSTDGRVVTGGLRVDQETELPNFTLIRYNKNNTDFVNITSIVDNSVITTKIPTVAGTSSAPANSASQVEILINGVSFTTTPTDGSGNWNAGNSSVLPIGQNVIQANLQDSMANTIVAHKTIITVEDNFSEDAVFAYNTTDQTKLTAGFTSLPFDNRILLGTWSYNTGTNEFTCNVTGRYYIDYMGHAGATSIGTGLTAINVGTSIFINGTEYVGSEANTNIDLQANNTKVLSKGLVKDLTAGDLITLQYGVTTTGVITVGTYTTGLILNPNSSGTQNPYSLAITRVG